MAYEEIKLAIPKRRRNQRPEVSVYTVESRRSPHLIDVRIRLTRPLMEELGWEPDATVVVLVGTHEHQGTIMLRRDEKGPFKFQPSKPHRTSSLLASRNIPLVAGLRKKVQWEKTDEGGLLLTI